MPPTLRAVPLVNNSKKWPGWAAGWNQKVAIWHKVPEEIRELVLAGDTSEKLWSTSTRLEYRSEIRDHYI